MGAANVDVSTGGDGGDPSTRGRGLDEALGLGRLSGAVRGIPEAVVRLAERQSGAITVAQALARGVDRSWLERQVRQGRWQRVHRGVLVTWSGPLTWRARAHAAVLSAGPGAALSHRAAAYQHEMLDRPPRLVDVSVPHARRPRPTRGIVIHRRTPMPPAFGRLPTVERACTLADLLSVARSVDEAIGVVANGVRAGVGPDDLRVLLAGRSRDRGRVLSLELVAAAEAGIESPLELRYHRDVGRRHRLPVPERQARDVVDGLWVRSDVLYRDHGLMVELDGVLWHRGARADADVWRDNAVLIGRDLLTLRYRWRHIAVTPCETAAQVSRALTARGWRGTPVPCGPACALA